MTVVESYDRSPIQNLVSCLALKPEKLIIVGDMKSMQKSVAVYKKVLCSQKLKTKVVPLHINTDNLQSAKKVLEKIVQEEKNCIFDLCGGDGLISAAAGMVYEENKDTRSVSLHEMNFQTGNPIDLDGDGSVPKAFPINLTIKEFIELCGGSVTEQTELDTSLSTSDIEPLWRGIKNNALDWNKKIGLLCRFEKYAVKNHLTFTVSTANLGGIIENLSLRFEEFKDIIDKLQTLNILKIKSKTDTEIKYTYNNQIYYNCVRKEGNTLEHKTYLEARDYLCAGKKAFCDVKMSVKIDWDGIVHSERFKDISNEIDVMAMHGITPVFISCKNGDIEEEFYKLNVVAERFGSGIAKKVLIATNYNPENQGVKETKALRAKEMGIIFEPDAADLDHIGWQNLFKKILET